MKKTIFAIAALALFTVGSSFAQYSPAQGNYNKNVPVYKADNTYGAYTIHQMDNIVNLTRKQQNEIKQIENRYDRITVISRKPTLKTIKSLELQKQQDILAVLSPVQHQRLMAYEQGLKYGRSHNNTNRSNRRG